MSDQPIDQRVNKLFDDLSGNEAIVTTTRLALSMLPVIGPVIEHLFNSLVPNYRLNRLAELLIQLEDKLDPKVLAESMQVEMKAIVIETAFESTIRSSKERITYLANLIANTCTGSEPGAFENQFLLKTLDSLSDAQVLYLCYHGAEAADERDRLRVRLLSIDPDQDVLLQSGMRIGYNRDLIGQGLIEMDPKSFESSTDVVADLVNHRYKHLVTDVGRKLLLLISESSASTEG